MGPEDGITENLKNVYENARAELDPNYKKKMMKQKEMEQDQDTLEKSPDPNRPPHEQDSEA